MKTAIIVTLIFLSQPASFADNPVWDSITNKTWVTFDCWAGAQIVFYRTQNGLPKAIFQLCGSGVYFVGSFIYDVEVDGDSIVLTSGLNLKPRRVIENKAESKAVLQYDPGKNIISWDSLNFKVWSDSSMIYNWEKSPMSGKIIDIKLLENIPLDKNSVYEKELIENI